MKVPAPNVSVALMVTTLTLPGTSFGRPAFHDRLGNRDKPLILVSAAISQSFVSWWLSLDAHLLISTLKT